MNPLEEYEAPTDQELITITFLDKLATRLGNPSDLTTEAGLKLMDALIGAWEKHFPQEVKDWKYDVAMDLRFEKSLKDLSKDDVGLYNPAGYPPMLFKLIKTMFPNLKLQNKKVFMKLIQIYPGLFKTSNYI